MREADMGGEGRECSTRGSGCRRVLSLVLLLALILAVLATIYIALLPPPGEPFTEFYMLGERGKAADYPTHLMVGEKGTVIVGIVNHEHAPITYRLVVRLDGVVVHTESVPLEDGKKWEKSIAFSPTHRGKQRLELLLYRNGEVYRSLHLWVDVV